jgi:hypothetical protein
MNLEDELRGALNVAAPPPTTTLDVVLQRGRRRVFAQRAGAVLGVVAVVAGIGFGAATLNQAAPREPADRLDPGPATVVHELGWPRVSTPPQKPYDTWRPASSAPPPAGRAVAEVPMCDMKPSTRQRVVQLGQQSVSPAFVSAFLVRVREELPGMTIGDPESNASGTNYEFDVSDAGGTGSIRLSAGKFTGTPLEHADDALWETGDCEPARRLHSGDGSIMQLHSVRPYEPFQSLIQVLAVYRKDGLHVQLELRNFGSPDVRSNPNQPGVSQRIGAGRPTLPLSEEQFARLGPAVAAVA